jgi:glycerol uptake facilitator-like aquaporin
MSNKPSTPMLAKVVGLVTAAAAAWIASQVVNQSWQAARGHKPPKAEDPGDAALAEIVAAAALTGAVVAVARVFATRGTARFAERAKRDPNIPDITA